VPKLAHGPNNSTVELTVSSSAELFGLRIAVSRIRPCRRRVADSPEPAARLASPVSSERVSTLRPHLADMDRLLRDIQTELVPDREPSPALGTAAIPAPPALTPADPASPPPEPPPSPPPSRSEQSLDTTAQLHALTELSESLMASMRELLDGYERVLAHARASTREPTGP
jgi:hypothetical protein